MSKDYAKYASIKRMPKKRHPLLPIGIISLVLIIGGISVFGFYKLHKGAGENTKTEVFFAKLGSFFHHKPKNLTPVATRQPATIAKAEQEVHFDFYNELPNMKVHVSANAAKKPAIVSAPAIKTTPAAKEQAAQQAQTNYFIRIGTFKDENEASQMRVSLLLSGIDADVIKIGESFHVQQGPYASAAQAKVTQKKLQKLGIESSIQETGT